MMGGSAWCLSGKVDARDRLRRSLERWVCVLGYGKARGNICHSVVSAVVPRPRSKVDLTERQWKHTEARQDALQRRRCLCPTPPTSATPLVSRRPPAPAMLHSAGHRSRRQIQDTRPRRSAPIGTSAQISGNRRPLGPGGRAFPHRGRDHPRYDAHTFCASRRVPRHRLVLDHPRRARTVGAT